MCDEIVSGKSGITMTFYIDDEAGVRVGEVPTTAKVGASNSVRAGAGGFSQGGPASSFLGS